MSFPTKNYFVTIAKKIVWLILIAALLATTACVSKTDTATMLPTEYVPSQGDIPTATSATNQKIFFPQQDAVEGEREAMTALTFGTLVVVDDCIRLNHDGSDTSHLLVWPPDFTLNTENDMIQIFNGDGKVTAHVGDQVQVDGGEVWAFSFFNESMQEKLPPNCSGPYWIVGYKVETSE